jgi:hypothetical protein
MSAPPNSRSLEQAQEEVLADYEDAEGEYAGDEDVEGDYDQEEYDELGNPVLGEGARFPITAALECLSLDDFLMLR